jgi:hypothetical protein
LGTLFKTVKVLMGVSGFMYLCKSLAEHTRMTLSERAAKQREEELRKQLLDEEMEAQDEEIKELEATLNRRSIAWAPE